MKHSTVSRKKKIMTIIKEIKDHIASLKLTDEQIRERWLTVEPDSTGEEEDEENADEESDVEEDDTTEQPEEDDLMAKLEAMLDKKLAEMKGGKPKPKIKKKRKKTPKPKPKIETDSFQMI